MEPPLFLDILHYSYGFSELLLAVLYGLAYPKFKQIPVAKALVYFFVFFGFSRLVSELVVYQYATVFPAVHFLMPLEAVLMFHVFAQLWPELKRWFWPYIAALALVFLAEEILVHNLFYSNWYFAVAEYSSLCLISYLNLAKNNHHMPRLEFLISSAFMAFIPITMVFIIFDHVIRKSTEIAIYAFSIIHVVYILFACFFLYIYYLLRRKTA
jgi:hypothetical protein